MSKIDDRLAEYKIGFQLPPDLDLHTHLDNYKQALYKDMVELIGKMEHTTVVSKEDIEDELDGGNAVTLKQKATTARNQLRQELRTKAKEYYGVEE